MLRLSLAVWPGHHVQCGKVPVKRWKLPDEIIDVVEHNEVVTEPGSVTEEMCILN